MTVTSDAPAPSQADAPPTATSSAARPDGDSILAKVVPALILAATVIGAWYFVTYVVLDERRRFLLRPPHQVIDKAFLDWDTLNEMLNGLWSSTRVAAIGLIIAILLGFVLATMMSQAKVVERAMFPLLVTLQAIPILAIVPLIVFWFGSGQNARIIVCVIIALFPIIVNTLFGLQSADRAMHDLFTLHHASRVTRLRKLMFPNALPAIFAGLRISAGLCVIGAIVGDFFFARGDVGIGQLIRRYSSRLDGEELLGAVILTSALGVAVFLFFGWLQKLVIGKWYEPGQSGT